MNCGVGTGIAVMGAAACRPEQVPQAAPQYGFPQTGEVRHIRGDCSVACIYKQVYWARDRNDEAW
jgi:hypothetical protein